MKNRFTVVGFCVVPLGIVFSCFSPSSLWPAQQVAPGDLINLSPKELLSIWSSTRSAPVRSAATRSLLLHPSRSRTVLREALSWGNERERMLALRLLSEMRDAGAIPLAIELLRSPSVHVRRRAALLLGHLKAAEAYSSLTNLLTKDGGDVGLLKSTIISLGRIGDKRATSLIRLFLTHQNDSVCVNAAIALSLLDDYSGFKVVLAHLESRDLQAQREAVYGLGFFVREEALSILRRIISTHDARWRSEAFVALARIDVLSSPPSDRVSTIQRHSKHSNKRVRR